MKNCTKMCSNTCSPIVCEGDICYPDSTLPQICKDGLTPDKDGLVEYKFLEGYIEGEGFNIKKCLLGAQADAANNSYKLIDEKNANAVADNPYCSILCREQYSIRVPYKQTVEEGRYFKITLSMKGQQDCYSTRFDDALFNEKVEETENKIIEAINKFNVFNVLANLDFDTDLQASNVLYCNKASCTVNLTASGCTKGSYTSTEDAWKVIQYDVISKNVIQFYKNLNGDIGSTSQSLESLIQKYNNDDRDDYELLLRYGIMGDQTEGSVSCNFKDEGTHYTTSFTSGSLTITRSGTRFNYRLDNSGNDDEISLSYIIRGYSSDGSLLFKTNLNVSAESDSVESGTVQGQGSISYFTVAPASRDNNISCELSDNQEVCKKTEAEDHFNSKIKDYKTYLKAAQKDVIDLVEELKKTIDQYNSCVGDKNYETLSEGYQDSAFWNMVYKYDPEIKYSYDEPDPTNPSRHKWIGDVQNTSCGDGNCDIMFAKNEEVKAEDCAEDSSVKCTSLGSEGKIESLFSGEEQYVNTYCTGEINDDYSCKSGELHTLDDSTYDNYDFFMCKYNESTAQFDCGSESHPVTKVKYIHKAAVGSGDYDTRLVYYTEHGTGEIKIQYLEDPTLNKNYSQVPGVPVSADTPQGTYIYILNIQNVGTFYNSGELGRIYSSKSNSLSTYARNLQGSSASYPITSGVGSDASDTDKEIAINEYA